MPKCPECGADPDLLTQAQARCAELREILSEMTDEYSHEHNSEFGISSEHVGEMLEIVIKARAALKEKS